MTTFDSGMAGRIYVKKGYEKDINRRIEMLDNIYNGWVYDVSLFEEDYCSCCDNLKDSLCIESYMCFTEEDRKQAHEEFKELIKKYETKNL